MLSRSSNEPVSGSRAKRLASITFPHSNEGSGPIFVAQKFVACHSRIEVFYASKSASLYTNKWEFLHTHRLTSPVDCAVCAWERTAMRIWSEGRGMRYTE